MRLVVTLVLLGGMHFSAAQPLDTNWMPLFNGTDLNNWYSYVVPPGQASRKYDIPTADPDSTYRIVNGVIVHRIRAGFNQTSALLVTDSMYSRYRFRVDYKFGPNCSQGVAPYCKNSGLNYHMIQDGVWGVGIESNMYWSWPTAFAPLGGVTVVASRPGFGNFQAGADSMSQWTSDTGWNTMEVRVWGDSAVEQWVNGRLGGWGRGIRQPGGAPLIRGRISLQAEGNDVSFRNPEIRAHTSPVGITTYGSPAEFFTFANDRLTIREHGIFSVEAFDFHGRKVFSRLSERNTTLDFRKLLPSGIYLVRLNGKYAGSQRRVSAKMVL